MQRITKYKMRGSTLAEMLVMMVVAGIVCMAVLDGMGLFTRLLLQRTTHLQKIERQVDGYYRTEMLIAQADSLSDAEGGIILHRSDSMAMILWQDSALLYIAEPFRDTLLQEIEALQLTRGTNRTSDTVEIVFQRDERSFTAKFTPRTDAKKEYQSKLAQIERGYSYEK